MGTSLELHNWKGSRERKHQNDRLNVILVKSVSDLDR